MEEVLHSHLAGEIGEHHHAVVGAILSRCIAKRRHLVGEVHQVFHILDSLTSSGGSRRLRDGIDTHVLLTTIDIPKTTGDALKHTLGIGHIVVAEESTLRSHVCKGYHRTIFGNGILLLSHLKHLVERDSRDVEGLLQEIVVEIVVRAMLAHIGTHTN